MRYAKIIMMLFCCVFVILGCGKKKTQINNDKNYLYPITVNGKGGYINRGGTIVIDPIYDSVFDFREGLAKVGLNGKYGYINTKGEVVIEPIYTIAFGFAEGLAAVAEKRHLGFIDREGVLKIPYKFTGFSAYFSEGLAAVCLEYFFGKGLCRILYIDKSGDIVLEIKPKTNEFFDLGDFRNGLARVCSKSGKCGYINKNGEMVIPQQYDYAGDFSEGLAAFKKDGKYGYIDTNNSVIISAQFDNALEFSEGIAPIKRGQLYGYINKSGRTVVSERFVSAKPFLYGLAQVKERINSKLYQGYINKKGKYVWKHEVDE